MKNNLKVIIISAFTAFTILGAILINNLFKNNNKVNYTITETRVKKKDVSTTTVKELFTVTIDGEVLYRGTYEFIEPVSIKKVLELSGGFTPLADDSLKNSNLIIESDTTIFVAKKNGNSYLIKNGEGMPKVNINTANSELLEKLDGIGPAKAKKIIEYRTIHGFYKSTEDLYLNEVITKELYEKIKDSITVW